MKKTINGKFDIKATPLTSEDSIKTIGAMRMMFEKKFMGELNAEGLVSMMGIMNKEIGSGGYVAIERITGELDGRKGSFCMQHSSVMNKGVPQQNISVIPDSATDQLVGLSGKMKIDIIEGQHFYTFEYELA